MSSPEDLWRADRELMKRDWKRIFGSLVEHGILEIHCGVNTKYCFTESFKRLLENCIASEGVLEHGLARAVVNMYPGDKDIAEMQKRAAVVTSLYNNFERPDATLAKFR